MNIGEYIKKIREEKELSINQLALYSNVSAAHISRIERGLREPSPEILKKISEVLKVPYEELMRVAGYLEPNTSTPADKEPALDDEQIKEIKEKFPNLFTLLARAKGPIPEILADQITDIAKTLLKEYLENEGKKDPEKGK